VTEFHMGASLSLSLSRSFSLSLCERDINDALSFSALHPLLPHTSSVIVMVIAVFWIWACFACCNGCGYDFLVGTMVVIVIVAMGTIVMWHITGHKHEHVENIYDHPDVILIPRAKPNFTYKMKIVLGFLQITTNIALALDLKWPSTYQSFIASFGTQEGMR